MGETRKPRELVFEELKHTWGIDKTPAFKMLASDRRVSDKEGKHATGKTSFYKEDPVKYLPEDFKPFDKTSTELLARMRSTQKGPRTNGEIIDYLSGEASERLVESFGLYGINPAIYTNAVNDVVNNGELSETDKAQLLVILFFAAGCTGDVRLAVEQMNAAKKPMGARFVTMQSDDFLENEATVEDLVLIRTDTPGKEGGYPLSTDPEGTVIGRTTTEKHAVNDAAGDVSEYHARIWRDDKGVWWLEDLGSTNGTWIRTGFPAETIVVAPPKDKREPKTTYGPVKIDGGDELLFGAVTEFLVTYA